MSILALSFNDVKLEAIQQDNSIWLGATQIGLALGYANPETAIIKLYNRNSDEFRDDMTKLVEMNTSGGLQKIRIFSLRGCHLIAMFARTDVAKAFRKWVLDILDKHVGAPVAKTHKSERTPLHDAHAMLVAKTKHLNSSDAWKIINQRFGTQSIDEIPYDAIPVAVEYVHHLIALYSKANTWGDTEPHIQAVLHDKNVQFLMWYVPILAKFIKNEIFPALTAIQSSYAGHLSTLTSEAVCHANLLNRKAIGYGIKLEHVGNESPHTIEWYLGS